MGLKFTKRQWLTLIVMALTDFCNAVCVSLQVSGGVTSFEFDVGIEENCGRFSRCQISTSMLMSKSSVVIFDFYFDEITEFPTEQAPFFPQEAEKKGANATEYGLVFGIFELVVFFISPIYGQYLNRIGPKVSEPSMGC